ncbi:formate/nitrite transporter family protein [Actinotalea ferrariae]|uniref:formate/nitrite transporter family protein n=1 Tax=Actinotalea ferrariae TaxID=1386098 RepID=UPI001C8C610E|nr:formate/nitrite transporter family protein [Actinotalea ferrariae]MBX9245908.1 formate/nitrite transporter family protein [Actinotalea ferrariae]
MLSIPDALAAQRRTAAAKADAARRTLPYLVQAMLGGAFIGVAVVLMLSAAGPLRAAGSPWAPLVQGLVFGVALTLVVTAGGELATSNMMTLTQGAAGAAVGWGRAAGTLALSFVGNLLGGFTFAVMVHLSGVVAPGTPAGAMLAGLLEHKAHATTGQLFWRAVLCNMLVCLAIWAGARLTSEGARLAVVFWCLLAFITSGFEHVVANMTTFALGLIGGLPETSWVELGRNLLVVGVGNVVGGAVLVGLAYVVAGRTAPDPVPLRERAADTERVPSSAGAGPALV